MQPTKNRIIAIVDDYKRMFAEEYAVVKEAVALKKKMAADEYASIQGTDYGRALYEIPQTLDAMLRTNLPEEDLIWLREGGTKRTDGARWFAKQFREFALPDSL